MVNYSTVVQNESGIHARPAKVLVNEAKKYKSEIKIKANGKVVNAKSIISVMTLGAIKGTPVELTFSGEDEEFAYNSIKSLFDNNLYE